MTTALVLAGDRGEGDPLARAENVPLKAFIDLHGTPMIDRVMQTLDACESIRHILVCIPAQENMEQLAPFTASLIQDGKAEIIPPAQSPVDSVAKGFEAVHGSPELLITTADHPLLSLEILEEFLNQIENGVTVGVINLKTVENAYPQNKRTKIHFSDGNYGGTNLFYFRGRESENILKLWKNLQKHRKHPIKMASKIGFGMIFDYLLGRLSLFRAFERISDRAQTKVKPVILNDAHASIDVDKDEDLKLVREILAQKIET